MSCNTKIGTRQSINKNALIDYIITENFKKCFVTESILNSDHYGTVVILEEKMMMKQMPIKKTFFDKKNCSKEKFQEYIRSSDRSLFWMSQNANEMMFQFCIIVEQAVNVHAPLKFCFVRNDKPKIFLNRNKFLSGKNVKSENEASLLKEFISLNTEKSRWKFIQEVRNNERQRIVIDTLLNSFGELITNEKDIANFLNFKFPILGEYFVESKKFDKTLFSADTGNANRFFFKQVTCKEVHDLIKCLNVNKPLGPSRIPAWSLKDAQSVLAEPLCFLIKELISESSFPTDLKRALVSPLYEIGNTEDPTNYRPLSVTGALAKIFEQVIRNQINDYLISNNLLSPKKFGYRKKVSTTDAILHCTEYVRTEMDKKNTVCGAFLDLSKAFDSISHEILIEKLKCLGFDGTYTQLIRSYLKDRTQKMVFSGNEADWILISRGEPQGTVLGQILFNIYVNDLHRAFDNDNCQVIQYADVTFLYSSHTNENIARSYLEKNIEKICYHFQSHQIIVFAPSKKARTPSYLNANDVNIGESSSVRYLGILLDNKLNFKEEIKRILSRMACSIKILKDIRNCFPIKKRVTLLNALVLSHIQYSSLMLVGIRKNLMITLEKQFNWGIKVCFKRKKYDRSTDLKIKNRFMPVEFLLKYRCMVFFLKYVRKQLTAFRNNNVLQTSNCKQNARTGNPAMKSNSEFLDKSLMLQAMKLYNDFPYEQRQKLDKVQNIKGF